MLHALVLAAQALPVGYRSKNTRAEQAVALGLEGAVVDGFGLSDFTMRPTPDFFRRCQADADRIEIGNRVRHVKGARTIQGDPPLFAALRGRLRFSLVLSSRFSVLNEVRDLIHSCLTTPRTGPAGKFFYFPLLIFHLGS